MDGDTAVKHAGPDALAEIGRILAELRTRPGLTEKKPGVFYRGSAAYVHFHEDPAGLFADIKVDGEWQRYQCDSGPEEARLLARIRST